MPPVFRFAPLLGVHLAALVAACSGGAIGYGGRCTVPADCGGATPVCSLGGFCVECNSHALCGLGRLCGSRGFCVECEGHLDCPAGTPFCDPVAGDCLECRNAGDCPATEPVCDPASGRCTQGCTSSTQCGFGELCGSIGACVGCEGTTDCPSDRPLCDPHTFQCAECFTDQDCAPSEPRCIEQVCVECIQNTDCGTGNLCNPSLRCN